MKKYIVCFHDLATGKTSRIDHISVDDDYTAEQYIATNGLRSFVRDGSTITLEEEETETNKEFMELFEQLSEKDKQTVLEAMKSMTEESHTKE